jgi:hypothetical protein
MHPGKTIIALEYESLTRMRAITYVGESTRYPWFYHTGRVALICAFTHEVNRAFQIIRAFQFQHVLRCEYRTREWRIWDFHRLLSPIRIFSTPRRRSTFTD